MTLMFQQRCVLPWDWEHQTIREYTKVQWEIVPSAIFNDTCWYKKSWHHLFACSPKTLPNTGISIPILRLTVEAIFGKKIIVAHPNFKLSHSDGFSWCFCQGGIYIYNMYTYIQMYICNMKQTIPGFLIPISSASRICVFFHCKVFPPWNMTTWWSPSLVFQSLEVSNLEFLYCALAKVWPPKNGGWNSDIEGLFNFYNKTGLASMFFFLCFLWDLCRCVCIPQWYCCCSERWFYNLMVPDIHGFVSGPWSSFMTSRTFAARNITGNF